LYCLLKQVSAREEGSVFSLLTLLQLWKNARQADFPEPLWRRVKSTILGYRYWHDERGCDAMDFWGETRLRFTRPRCRPGRFSLTNVLLPLHALAISSSGWVKCA
jgi:hypothetical protein